MLALRRAAERLRQAGVDSPELDAGLLLAHLLGVSRAYLLAHPERPLAPGEEQAYAALLQRRANREPLPYLTGHREFYGLDLLVNPHMLIPRPETELLVELALTITPPASPLLIADVGTGSGAIAIALAVHLPQALVYASDVSGAALALAAENARRHGVAERIRFLSGDLCSALPEPVHLLVSNPPYLGDADLAEAPPEVARFEPRPALYGGADGLAVIRRLLAGAGPFMLPGGALLLEIGAAQGAAARALARQSFPAALVEVRPDYAGLDRLLLVKT
jgi:release factor glutamine methyltransferase